MAEPARMIAEAAKTAVMEGMSSRVVKEIGENGKVN